MRNRKILLAGLTAAFLIGAPAALALSAPFAWQGANWCPTYHGSNGCNNTQSPSQYTVSFAPSQVGMNAGHVQLYMNTTTKLSGAFNTQTQETYPIGSTFTAQVAVPCDSGNKIYNWPAFWTDGTTGTWPANGEIDVFEGQRGNPTFGVHYQNAQGPQTYDVTVTGNYCGEHTYSATWNATAVTFTWDGKQVGQITAATMGVPMFSDNQNVIFDYGAGSDGGTTMNGKTMTVFSYSG